MEDKVEAAPETPTLPRALVHPRLEMIKSGDEQRAKSNSLTSVDFETAISKSGCGKFNLAMLILAIPAAWTSGFVSGSMSYVIPAAAADLDLTPTGKASLQSACYAGMISSGFIWGFLSDKLGRKKLLVIGFLLDFVMNFLTGIVPSLPFMLVFKYLSGFMVAGPFSIFTAYISEVFLSKRRDVAVLSAGIFSSIGNIAQAALAMWIIPSEVPFQLPLKSWQLYHISCGIPSLICGIGCMFCVESPKFLIDHGDHQKALEVCRTIYTINTGNSPTTYPVKRLHHQISKNEAKKSFRESMNETVAIFRPPFVKRALLGFIIQFIVVAAANTLRLWLPEMLMLVNSSELDTEQGLCTLLVEGNRASTGSTSAQRESQTQVYTEMMFVNLGSMFGHIVFILLVSYLGKKILLIACSILSGVFAIIIPLVNSAYVFLPASAFIATNNVAFYSNIGIVVAVFPTRVRATMVGTTMLLGRSGILLVNFLIANLIYSFCDYFFYSLAVMSIGLTILGFFLSMEPIDEGTPKFKKQKSSNSLNA
ncbi:synaptic vesicle glycoprotein 2C [Halyomorpha halys]|uniref:synaptic vesicle glycoprotein 2C n=1 Tax=Halyomorpha halys TaxID=286706 RepID=UPI0006D4F900|nr:synaptic vesicle glycoprotein 2C-like [Halyomorpha halys]